MSVVIRKGKVLLQGVLKERTLVIDGGKIAEVLLPREPVQSYDEMIDAEGKIVLPGCIDVHVHVREPGFNHKEDWRTASMAAAHGGVTTLFDMPNNKEPTVDLERVEEKLALAGSKSLVNFGVYAGITAENRLVLERLKDAVCGYKLYMGKTTGTLLLHDEDKVCDALSHAAPTGRVVVAHTDFEGKDHIRGELENARMFIRAAQGTGAYAHVTHVATQEVAHALGSAQNEGIMVTGDCTQHHLFMTGRDREEKKAFAKMNPQLGSAEDQKALWEAIGQEVVQIIASDHAPHTREEKMQGFDEAPAGVPNLDTFLPLLLDAVNSGKLSLQRLVALTAENPAARFGVLEKGRIEAGYNADLVLVDMKEEARVRSDALFTKCGWSPFEGRVLKGWPALTMVGGNVVYEEGTCFEESCGSRVQLGSAQPLVKKGRKKEERNEGREE